MQEARQNACVNIARAGPIKPVDSRQIAPFLNSSNAGGKVRNIPPISVLNFERATARIRITAGRSAPHPGVTPGVAEGAEEGGRSCPLRGPSPTAGRAKHAVNARANVVEVQTFR